MPTIEDVMTKLAGAIVFSVRNVNDGFHQVKEHYPTHAIFIQCQMPGLV